MIGARYRDRGFGSNSSQNYSEWDGSDINKDFYKSNSERSRDW